MKIFVLLAAGLFTVVPARAASIGVNFAPASSAGILAATASAGVAPYAQTNYNNISASGTNFVLSDNNGLPTTARLTLAASGFLLITSSVTGADEALNTGFAYGRDSLTLTLTGIPYASYSLVVYDLFDEYNSGGGFTRPITIGSTSYWTTGPNPTSAGYIDNNAATAFTYTRGTGTTGDTATLNSDYVLFTGLGGSSQTINAPFGGNYGEISGFQIIQTVPEPGTWTLVSLGVVGAAILALRRRRDRPVVPSSAK